MLETLATYPSTWDTRTITSMMIPSARRGIPKKTGSVCVQADMKICCLDSIDPLNRAVWGLGVRHPSHLLPTPVPGTPAAVEQEHRGRRYRTCIGQNNHKTSMSLDHVM